MLDGTHRMAKAAALKKLLSLMDEHGVHELRGLKNKPAAAEVSVTKVAPLKKMDALASDEEPFVFGRSWDKDPGDDDQEESPDEEEGEPSAAEKEMIAQKYHRYFGKK